MSDVCKSELQYVLDGICKYLKQNRNHLAQDLFRQMHRDDYLGRYGYIHCHNDRFDIEVQIIRKRGEA